MSEHITVKDVRPGPHRADEPPGQEERADRGDVRRHGGGARKRQQSSRTFAASSSPARPARSRPATIWRSSRRPPRRGEGLALPVVRFLHALARSERPLVAAVQGLAVGVGTTMLLHCDHVVAGTDARFSTPFVSLGLVPEAASSLLAPRLMGHRRAFELLVMGRPLDAAAAQACGLVNAVVAPGDVEAEAMKAASISPRCRPRRLPRHAA